MARRKRRPFAVFRRGRDIVVAGFGDELRRWPLFGIVGAIAWRFDGSRLRIARVPRSFLTTSNN